MIKNFFPLFFLFTSLSVFSQIDTGQVSFNLYPVIGDSYVKINDSLHNQLRARLPVGNYDITLWAPDFSPLDTTITIYKDSLIYMRKVLKPTSEFSKYLDDKIRYKKQVIIPKVIYLTTSGVLTGATLTTYLRARKKLKRTDEAFRLFETSEIHSIESTKENYNDERKGYNNSKKIFYTTSAVTVISWGVTFWQLRRFKKKRTKPEYKRPASYFDISMQPAPFFINEKQKNDLLFTFKTNF
jgi:hypothetical protein